MKSQQSKSVKEFADLLEQYTPIVKLDAVLLNTLIEYYFAIYVRR